jgi:hypothetical protein
MAQHDRVGLAVDGIVLGSEQTAERRLKSEQREVASGNVQAGRRLRLLAGREARAEVPVGGDSDERLLRALEIAEHRIAEDGAAGVRTEPHAARPRSWIAQIDELFRIRHG